MFIDSIGSGQVRSPCQWLGWVGSRVKSSDPVPSLRCWQLSDGNTG